MNEGPTPVKKFGPDQNELNEFIANLSHVRSYGGANPEMEASRSIVEHFNQGNIQDFDKVGYFIYQGVKVFEAGKVADAKRRDALTTEERVFGGKS